MFNTVATWEHWYYTFWVFREGCVKYYVYVDKVRDLRPWRGAISEGTSGFAITQIELFLQIKRICDFNFNFKETEKFRLRTQHTNNGISRLIKNGLWWTTIVRFPEETAIIIFSATSTLARINACYFIFLYIED